MSVKHAVHYSSETGQWSTPWPFFSRLSLEFPFHIDVCATAADAKCGKWFSPEQDGLKQPWSPWCCWMNPPYGRGIGKWVQKAWDEAGKGAFVVCLLPARTDTNWWAVFWDHENHCTRNPRDEVRFIKGRLKFGDGKNSAPFPSAVVVMRPRT